MNIIIKGKYILAAVLALFIISGCAPRKQITKTEPPPPKTHFEALPQEGQLPEEVVREAAKRHGGSMDSEEGSLSSADMPSGQIVVMGPIYSVKGIVSIDAGQKIREVIAMVITADNEITLVDAPEERYKNDSPRPDLAKRRIKAVIKGVTSYNESSDKVTVVLRAVDTGTGNVLAMAAGRNPLIDDAASEAITLLIEKIKGGSDD